MKKKLLIVGGAHSDIPLIEAGKLLGYYVITTGNNSRDLGHKVSDEYHPSDYSDPQAILALATDLGIDAICPGCNDFSAIACSFVAGKLGLPGHDPYETSLALHHKDLYRSFAAQHGIMSPRSVSLSCEEDALDHVSRLDFPVIVKPVDLTGGKGINRVDTRDQLSASLAKAFSLSKAKRVVVEEFIEGTRHGFSSFIENQKVTFGFLDDEHYYKNPYMVSAASYPGTPNSEIRDKLRSSCERIAEAAGLKDGILHVQFILRGGDPYIIEVCRRPPGDLYIKFVEIVTGINYPALIVASFCGQKFIGSQSQGSRNFVTRHCIMSKDTGKVIDVKIHDSVRENIVDSLLWWKSGDRITDHLTQKLGIVFLEFSSEEEMSQKTVRLNELISPVLE